LGYPATSNVFDSVLPHWKEVECSTTLKRRWMAAVFAKGHWTLSDALSLNIYTCDTHGHSFRISILSLGKEYFVSLLLHRTCNGEPLLSGVVNRSIFSHYTILAQ